MKHLIILLFFALVIIPSQAQVNKESTASGVNLKSSAEKMGKLFVQKKLIVSGNEIQSIIPPVTKPEFYND